MNAVHNLATHCFILAAVGQVADNLHVLHDDHPVGQQNHLGQITGNQQDRDPLFGQIPDQSVKISLGPDVDTDGRLINNQDLHLGCQPFGDTDFLLITAGEVADALLQRWRDNILNLLH